MYRYEHFDNNLRSSFITPHKTLLMASLPNFTLIGATCRSVFVERKNKNKNRFVSKTIPTGHAYA